jgi:hypothetical protein
MAKYTEAALSLLAAAMKSAESRRGHRHSSLSKQATLRQQLRRNMAPFLDRLRDHLLTSAGITIADFLAAQSRNTGLFAAALRTSSAPVEPDRDESNS